MGATVAASVALGHHPDLMVENFLRSFKSNPTADYTIPIIALTRGRRMRQLLMEHCGEALIENSWKKFFCVSANLSSGEAMVHKEGFLWRALRASAAIPDLVPPMVMDGQVFVDRGIMNNFPASVMGLAAARTGGRGRCHFRLEAGDPGQRHRGQIPVVAFGERAHGSPQHCPHSHAFGDQKWRCSDGRQPRRCRCLDLPGAGLDQHVVVHGAR